MERLLSQDMPTSAVSIDLLSCAIVGRQPGYDFQWRWPRAPGDGGLALPRVPGSVTVLLPRARPHRHRAGRRPRPARARRAGRPDRRVRQRQPVLGLGRAYRSRSGRRGRQPTADRDRPDRGVGRGRARGSAAAARGQAEAPGGADASRGPRPGADRADDPLVLRRSRAGADHPARRHQRQLALHPPRSTAWRGGPVQGLTDPSDRAAGGQVPGIRDAQHARRRRSSSACW